MTDVLALLSVVAAKVLQDFAAIFFSPKHILLTTQNPGGDRNLRTRAGWLLFTLRPAPSPKLASAAGRRGVIEIHRGASLPTNR